MAVAGGATYCAAVLPNLYAAPAVGVLILVAAALYSGAANASWLWLLAYFVVLTLGELYLSLVGLSFVTKVAPVRMLSMMMGIWLAASFTGGFLAGFIGSFWSRMGKPEFFLLVAGVAALAGTMILACQWVGKGIVLRRRRW